MPKIKVNISSVDRGKSQSAVLKTVAIAGTQAKLARQLGCCNGNVSLWVNGVQLIPIYRAIECERLTKGKVKTSELRPDFF